MAYKEERQLFFKAGREKLLVRVRVRTRDGSDFYDADAWTIGSDGMLHVYRSGECLATYAQFDSVRIEDAE